MGNFLVLVSLHYCLLSVSVCVPDIPTCFCVFNPSLSHLPSFIRLVDYMVVNTLHTLVVNAVAKLLAELQELVLQTPSHATIQSWSQHHEATADCAGEGTDKKVGHCFSIINS